MYPQISKLCRAMSHWQMGPYFRTYEGVWVLELDQNVYYSLGHVDGGLVHEVHHLLESVGGEDGRELPPRRPPLRPLQRRERLLPQVVRLGVAERRQAAEGAVHEVVEILHYNKLR